MLKNSLIKKTVLALTVVAGLSVSMTAFAKSSFTGEYRQGEILSFGSSLNQREEAALRDYFGVSDEMEAIYVDNETAIKQLGLAPDALDDYKGGWYSSAYVKLTDQGGINVSSKNVSLVTNEMFANALITSGILNCEVIVSAPFMVTGESALAGILAGAEEIMGESLSEENKVVAKEEIDTTLEIADEILNNPDNEINSSSDSSTVASGIINDIKQQVIKDSPNSTQIEQIIVNVTNNYGVELSEESTERIANLMEDVNKLDIDYNDIKETMKNIGDSISESLKEAGVKLKESGVLEKIGNWFVDLVRGISEWIKGLFISSNEVDSPILNEEEPSDMNASIESSDESGEVEVFEPSTSKETDINTEDLTAGENVDENQPKDNDEQNSEENEEELVPEETSNDLENNESVSE
ncbi:Predicted secreted protein [Turicibacter sanguinis]|nr:Predicted secreted protein [Turicibacter sanguinis]